MIRVSILYDPIQEGHEGLMCEKPMSKANIGLYACNQKTDGEL